jgi:hypothetical protein
MLRNIKHKKWSKTAKNCHGRPTSCKFTSMTVLACRRSYLLNASLYLLLNFAMTLLDLYLNIFFFGLVRLGAPNWS